MYKKILTVSFAFILLSCTIFYFILLNNSDDSCFLSLDTKLNIPASKNGQPSVAYNKISLTSDKHYILETEYTWQGVPANYGQFYFDLYIPGKWDKSKYNFMPNVSKCVAGKYIYTKTFFLDAPQTSMYFRIINASKGKVTITKCQIRELSKSEDILLTLKNMSVNHTIKNSFIIFVLLIIVCFVINKLNLHVKNIIIKSLFCVSICVVVLNIIYNLLYVKLFGTNFPYLDDWYFVGFVNKIYNHNIRFLDLFHQNGPHRPFTLNIITYFICLLTNYNLKAILYSTQLLYIFIGLILFFKFSCDNYKKSTIHSLILFAPIFLLLFHIRQYEIILWPMCMGIILTEFLVLTTFFCLTKMNSDNKQMNILLFIISVFTALLATYTYIHGVMVWILGLLILLFLSINFKKKILYISIWITIGTIVTFFFFYTWKTGQVKSKPINLNTFVLYLKSLVTLIGGSLCWNKSNAFILGCFLTPISLLIILITLIKKQFLKNNIFWLASAFFSFGVLLMILLGRNLNYPPTTVTSRYSAYSLLLLISVYAIFINNFYITRKTFFLVFIGIMLSFLFYSLIVSFNKGIIYGKVFKSDLRLKQFGIKTYEIKQPSYIKKTLGISNKTLQKSLRIFKKNKWNVFDNNMPTDTFPFHYTQKTNKFYFYLNINGNKISNNFVDIKLNKREFLEITGSAFDSLLNSFNNVYIQINTNKLYKGFYGIYSPNIAKKYNKKQLRFTKYYIAIPSKELSTGEEKIRFYFINHNNKFYNTQTFNINIIKNEK